MGVGRTVANWCVLVLSGVMLSGGMAEAQEEPSPQPAGTPVLRFSQPERNAALGGAYRGALRNLLETNTVPYVGQGKERTYNQTGLLARSPDTFFRAGGGYSQPWTRDASVNSWNGGSLLAPAVARNTLLSVLRREANGQLIVQQDNQWWDQVIWAVAAWNHFLVTGDQKFLREAYQAAGNTLERDKTLHFNAEHGLFEGAAFLNDGIAGYPAPPADATESRGSFVLDYPGSAKQMPLSTNCLYVGAYRATAQMATELQRPAEEIARWTAAADALSGRIRDQFWVSSEGRFGYLISPEGVLDPSQEGSGLAFALLFGIATPEQTASVLRVAHEEPFGMPDVWPAFARYSATQPGRHNVIVWPPIESFWAEASARAGDVAVFSREVETLAGLAGSDRNTFWEIYNGTTGVPDGGWQTGHAWYSEPNQTWSATGYLRMIYTGLFGMRPGVNGLAFAPTLPAAWGDVSLAHVRYRRAVLQVMLHGAGTVVRSFRLDGVERADHTVPAGLHGAHTVEIELAAS